MSSSAQKKWKANGVTVSQRTADKITATSGVKTRVWGPHFWRTLFFVAMNYPNEVSDSKCDQVIRRQYYNFYQSLQWTLPCGWCLESYRRFWKEDDILKYMDSRIDLLRWVYELKDKVNKKLIFQEKQQLSAVKQQLNLQLQAKKITAKQMQSMLTQATSRICRTQKSPTFKQVLDSLAEHRA